MDGIGYGNRIGKFGSIFSYEGETAAQSRAEISDIGLDINLLSKKYTQTSRMSLILVVVFKDVRHASRRIIVGRFQDQGVMVGA